jgi:hypothetical protein
LCLPVFLIGVAFGVFTAGFAFVVFGAVFAVVFFATDPLLIDADALVAAERVGRTIPMS